VPELSSRRKYLILAICCCSLLMVSIDNTIVNLALPSIRTDLNAPVSGLQWIVDAYTLVLASLLMLSGSMADRIGRKRASQTGLLLFSGGSLLCSLAPNLGWLIAFRALQAVGGSLLNPVALSIVTNVFTEPRERARAIGIWGGVIGIGFTLGPVLGGALVGSIGWRSIFWVNVPVGIVAVVLTALFTPESKAPRPRRIDPVGQLLIALALASATYAIIEGGRLGWTAPIILGAILIAVGSVLGVIWYEPRRTDPLLDLRFFRSVPFTGATITAVFAFASLGAFLFLNALYLQDVRHMSAIRTGLCTVPTAAMTLIFAPLAGRIVGSRGSRLPLIVAGVGMAVSAGMLVTLTATTPIWWLLLSYTIFGIGFGVVNPPISNAAVSGMPRAQAGVAASIASTSRQVGQSLGVAVIGSVVSSGVRGPIETGFAAASHAGWWILVACAIGVLIVGLVTTSPWARQTAARAAAEFDDEYLVSAGGSPAREEKAR
jgi:EmrB/QacA subfamily drug resistance transporter